MAPLRSIRVVDVDDALMKKKEQHRHISPSPLEEGKNVMCWDVIWRVKYVFAQSQCRQYIDYFLVKGIPLYVKDLLLTCL